MSVSVNNGGYDRIYNEHHFQFRHFFEELR